jgi:Alr-MurF fusion protein
MLNYRLTHLAQVLNAKLMGSTSNATVKGVIIDSRVVVHTEGMVFFALVGEQHNGHSFITDLYARGVRLFVVSQPNEYTRKYPEAAFLMVKNSLEALQLLAAHHRKSSQLPVIGITGSNGKTIVKEWLAQLLYIDYSIVRSPKSYNSQVGVPLSVLQINPQHTLGIFEAGISLPDEMQRLEPMICPSIGVFTNIGEAHQRNFSSLEAKAKEKMKLFVRVQTLVYCVDHLVVDGVVQETVADAKFKLFTWGRHPKANVVLQKVERFQDGTTIGVVYNQSPMEFTIPFTDDASLENAMHCLCVLLHLGVPANAIAHRMANLLPVAMRLEQKEGINGCTIINDSYNSDLGSLSIALDFLAQQRQHSQRILILSDIQQSGRDIKSLYTEVSILSTDKGVTQIIGIGEEISSFADLFSKGSFFYRSTDDFLKAYNRNQYKNSAILIKGSRSFRFERISSLLEQKTHRTILEINLNALVSNLNYFRSLLQPNVRVMAMVKAFSYGSGSHEIANLLQFHRVDYLGVAFADEGISLREAGINLPIVVLNPAFDSYDLMIDYNLEPEVFSFSSLNGIIEVAKRQGVSNYPIHIKIDTGMHRLGFLEDDIPELAKLLKEQSQVSVESIFSHLVATDDAQLDDFTNKQIEHFTRVYNNISSVLGYGPTRHILNSAGIERFPDAQFDMVRLGIGLYGVSVAHEKHLQVVNSLKTYIAQIRNLDVGDTVGYNRRGKITRPSVIATIPIGYADGLNRRLSNGKGSVLVNGALAPIIGNVSMDTCTIDVTDIPSAKEGDEVVVFGDKPSVLEIAEQLETIPYEVLTSVSRRVKRVYIQE